MTQPPGLDYADAWATWNAEEAAAWEATVGDGLTPEPPVEPLNGPIRSGG